MLKLNRQKNNFKSNNLKNKNIISIIVTYKRINNLKKIIKKLIKQTYPVKKIIIINNDVEKKIILKELSLNSRKVILINSSINLGAAAGFNLGIQIGLKYKPDYYLLIDDEILPKENSLEKLIKFTDDKTLLNSVVLDYETKKTLPLTMIDLDTKDIYLLKKDLKKDITKWLSPWNFTLIPKNVFVKVGLINEKLFGNGEEFDFMFRSLIKDFKFYTVKSSEVYYLRSNPGVIKFFGLFFNKSHSPYNYYYEMRNLFYLRRVYKKSLIKSDYSYFKKIFFKYQNDLLYLTLLFILKFLNIIFFNNQKFKKIFYLLRGYFDGLVIYFFKYKEFQKSIKHLKDDASSL